MYFPHKALNSTSALDSGAILHGDVTRTHTKHNSVGSVALHRQGGDLLQEHKLQHEGGVTSFGFSRGHMPPLEH